jgi:hypothetical protein
LNDFETQAPKQDDFINKLQKKLGINIPVEPRGNPKFLKNIYSNIE